MHLTAKGQRFCFSLVERETGAVMPSLEKVSDELRAASCKIAGEISQAGALQRGGRLKRPTWDSAEGELKTSTNRRMLWT